MLYGQFFFEQTKPCQWTCHSIHNISYIWKYDNFVSLSLWLKFYAASFKELLKLKKKIGLFDVLKIHFIVSFKVNIVWYILIIRFSKI